METKLAVKDRNRLTILQIVLEMQARGIQFTNIDIYKSDPVKFLLTDSGMIRPPLNALPGLGAAAADNIAHARLAGPFIFGRGFEGQGGRIERSAGSTGQVQVPGGHTEEEPGLAV